MLRLIVQQLVHHIPGHAHGKEVYLPGEVLGLLVTSSNSSSNSRGSEDRIGLYDVAA